MYKHLIFRIALGAAFILPIASNAQELIGRASVIDGDTVEIHGERVRILAVDAPEVCRVLKMRDLGG